MCGRFALSVTTNKVEKLIPGLKSPEPIQPRFNIAPTQNIAAVVNDGQKQVSFLRWGLIPFWAKDKSIGSRMINARSETIEEKASFRHSFKKRRCLILADGFYEWRKVKGSKSKTPFFIRLKSKEPFAFAGLWDKWTDKESGEIVHSATIITTRPNSLMEPIHDRMPVIVDPDLLELWISEDAVPQDELKGILEPFPAKLMEAYEVAPLVNNPGYDNESCTRPADNLGF